LKKKQTSLFAASVEAQSGQKNCSEFIAKVEEWPAFKRVSNVADDFDVTPKTTSIRVPTQKHHPNHWRPKRKRPSVPLFRIGCSVQQQRIC
jgi:hypothetical protein